MKASLRRLWFEVRMRLASEPPLRPLYGLVIWWGQYKIRQRGAISPEERVVTPQTEIVIDGYQGSANSFLTVAFKYAQTRPVRLAHHLHSPLQIIEAVRLGVPTLVTAREPRGAALSLTSRWPHVTIAQALRAYIRFYERLLPHTHGFVVSSFEQTTRTPGEPMRLVNQVFGTNFDLFEPTPENIAAVQGAEGQFEKELAARKDLKARKAREFDDPACQRLLAEAQTVFERFMAAPSAGRPVSQETPIVTTS